MNIFPITIALGDPGAGNKQLFAFRAPSAGFGGGVTILSGYASNATTQGAGTSFSVALHKYSSAGTPAVNGTIAAAIGGTAATFWTANIPQAFTIDTDYAYLSAGEWLVVDYQEDTSGNPAGGMVTVWAAQGK